MGVSSPKGDFLHNDVKNWLKLVQKEHLKNWRITYNYHFGSYAKHKRELVTFINNFKVAWGIALDPIYIGKMMFGVMDMAANECFKPNSKVRVIHTGKRQ